MINKGTDRGAALILALLVTVLLAAMGVSLVLLGDTERSIARSYGSSSEARYGADAVLERVVRDLTPIPQWDAVLSGATQSSFADQTHRPTLPSSLIIDLDAITADLQAAATAVGALGTNTPVWRLFAWGPLSQLAPGRIDSAQYLVAWVADDLAETDADPAVDSNGAVMVHAEAYGIGGARRAVEATLTRVSPTMLRVSSWRELR